MQIKKNYYRLQNAVKDEGEGESGEKDKPVVDDKDEKEKPRNRYKEDLLAEKQKRKDVEAELATMRLKEEDQQTEALKENEQYKVLSEFQAGKMAELQAEIEDGKKAQKQRDLREALLREATKQGAKTEALDDIFTVADLGRLIYEEKDNGRFEVLGQEQLIEDLKKTKSFYFGSGSKPVNSSTGGTTESDKKTTTDLLTNLTKAQAVYRKDPTRDNLRKYEATLASYQSGES